jgi:prepilin-type N-terminal cleavage/methylation domain
MAKRPAQRGVTLVELLVTIVLASIFFAAMVPVFVGAARTSSKDNLRNIAVNVAQSKIEKIRGLQYDQIQADSTHLYSDTFENNQFGSEFESKSAGGTKTYWIFYATPIYPTNADPGKEDYKQVQVWVSWAPSPPVDVARLTSSDPTIANAEKAKLNSANSVTLRTLIYKQYAGPGIIGPPRITWPPLVEKPTIDSPPRTLYCVTARSMTIVIDVDPDQASSTVGVNVGIYSATGEVIEQLSDADSTTVTPPATPLGNNHWEVTWTAPDSVGDGAYVVTAAAVSDTGHIGNTASTDFRLELGPPDPVVLTATAGNKAIQLEWTLSDRDIDHFEIYRSLTSAFSSTPIQSDWQTASYTDPPASDPLALPLVNLQPYYYKVIAVDIFGQANPEPTSIGPVIPVPGDDTPPNNPSNLLWSASGKIITLLWTQSSGDVDFGPTVSGLGDYYLYRSSNGSPPWQEIWHGPGVTHSVGHLEYLQTMYYKVTAKDKALNESAPTNTVAATSEAAPHFDLHVVNPPGTTGNRYVRVHSESLTGPVVGDNTGWFKVDANTTNVTNWSGLVVGTYCVEWSNNQNGNGNLGNGSFTQLSSDPYTFPLQ